MVFKMSSMKFAPLLAFQLVLMVLFFIFVRYKSDKTENDIQGALPIHIQNILA